MGPIKVPASTVVRPLHTFRPLERFLGPAGRSGRGAFPEAAST